MSTDRNEVRSRNLHSVVNSICSIINTHITFNNLVYFKLKNSSRAIPSDIIAKCSNMAFNVETLHSKIFITLNAFWSRNVNRQQQERSQIVIFSGLSLSCQSNSQKLTRFKIAAGNFFTKAVFQPENFT